jgi:hypothetical protein
VTLGVVARSTAVTAAKQLVAAASFAQMVQNQHTEGTRKKLREAGFFLRLLAGVSGPVAMTPDPEAAEFYLSAFLSAARAVPLALKKERTAEWNAWSHKHWFVVMSESDGKLWDFLVEQRNKAHKEGGPDLTVTVTSVSLLEFIHEVQLLQGGSISISTVPGTPPPTIAALVKSFTARPGQTLAEACQPLFDLMSRMVDEFERAHPPA